MTNTKIIKASDNTVSEKDIENIVELATKTYRLARPGKLVTGSDRNGYNILMVAACAGHTDTVTTIIKLKDTMGTTLFAELVRKIDKHGNNFLMLAALNGHSETVRAVIQLKDLIGTELFAELIIGTELFAELINGTNKCSILRKLYSMINLKDVIGKHLFTDLLEGRVKIFFPL